MMEDNTGSALMQEENTGSGENRQEIRLGLEASDVDDYDVNDGETEAAEPADDAADRRRARSGSGRPRIAFAAGFLCCLALILLLTSGLGAGRFVTQKKYEYYKELDGSYGKYYEIMKLIGEDPIAETEPAGISDEELKEIVASTGDPYAEYFTAEEYKEVEKRYYGDYVGIGIAVAEEDGKVVIKSVFEDSPAEEAGFKAEDIIVKVDGKAPKDVDKAIEMISGESGTKLTVSVKRGGDSLDIETYRAKIDTDSVSYSALKEHPGIGYIRITSFIKGTDDEFRLAVRDLRAEGCESFIIDLRSNGGGLTAESIGIADYLLPACRIMSEVKKDGTEKVYNSKAGSADLELAVLVNGDTASASEILTAAIQDNKAGTVIGTKTYGKGVTQIAHKFSDGSAIKITSTEYFRPDGETVNGVGITPDIEAEGEDALAEALKVLEK